eukprot:COSAG02_NODE_628_length_19343_cov_15.829297_8_plen_214_part_00
MSKSYRARAIASFRRPVQRCPHVGQVCHLAALTCAAVTRQDRCAKPAEPRHAQPRNSGPCSSRQMKHSADGWLEAKPWSFSSRVGSGEARLVAFSVSSGQGASCAHPVLLVCVGSALALLVLLRCNMIAECRCAGGSPVVARRHRDSRHEQQHDRSTNLLARLTLSGRDCRWARRDGSRGAPLKDNDKHTVSLDTVRSDPGTASQSTAQMPGH